MKIKAVKRSKRESKQRVLTLYLRNPKNKRVRRIDFDILINKTATKWAQILYHILPYTDVNQDYLFHGWRRPDRDLNFLVDEINSALDEIDQFFKKGKKTSYRSVGRLNRNHFVQNDLNQAHLEFERLIGQMWDPSPLFQKANAKTQQAILNLNFRIHELESYLLEKKSKQQGRCSSQLVFHMRPNLPFPLSEEDFKRFRLHLGFGDVVLHYSQLGKTHWESFCDGDEHVSKKNISGLRSITGEFDIYFFSEDSVQMKRQKSRRFNKWLKDHGYNPTDPKLALGFLSVARLRRSQIKKTEKQFLASLFPYSQLAAIGLEFNGLSRYRAFN